MKHALSNFRSIAFCLALCTGLFCSAPLHAQQASDTPAFITNTTLATNLKNLTGKRVTLYLKSGSSLGGVVKSVGEHLVHLEKLDNNRDFYDALISMEQIAAIDTRVRNR